MTHIRHVREEDIPAILAIECAEFAPPWSEGSLLAQQGRDDIFFAAAVHDGKIIGFCILAKISGEAELYQIAVAQEYKRRGVGDMLMDAALDAAGSGNVFLEVRRSNAPAIALYKKHGFNTAGYRKNYYTDPTEDACVLVRGT